MVFGCFDFLPFCIVPIDFPNYLLVHITLPGREGFARGCWAELADTGFMTTRNLGLTDRFQVGYLYEQILRL